VAVDCGGPNSVFNDVWLLNMEGSIDTNVKQDNFIENKYFLLKTGLRWRWKELSVENQEHGACHMWCSPGCKVKEKVVFLCRRPNAQQASSPHHITTCLPRFVVDLFGFHRSKTHQPAQTISKIMLVKFPY
jgi:hypothetical protein